MSDEPSPSDDLRQALDGVELYTKRLDQLLTSIASELREAKEPTSVSKRAARAELDDLAELDNQLRRAEELLAAPKTDATNLRGDVEERMYKLCIPAERPNVPISGWKFTPQMKLRSIRPADGLTWESPQIHEALRAYGLGDLVSTNAHWQSVMAGVKELHTGTTFEVDENGRLPDVFIPELNEHGDPAFDLETGEVRGRTVNIDDLFVRNEKAIMSRTKGPK